MATAVEGMVDLTSTWHSDINHSENKESRQAVHRSFKIIFVCVKNKPAIQFKSVAFIEISEQFFFRKKKFCRN